MGLLLRCIPATSVQALYPGMIIAGTALTDEFSGGIFPKNTRRPIIAQCELCRRNWLRLRHLTSRALALALSGILMSHQRECRLSPQGDLVLKLSVCTPVFFIGLDIISN